MSLQMKSAMAKVLNRAEIKTAFILGALVVSALAGGAPSDFGW